MNFVSTNWQSIPRHMKDKYSVLAHQDKRRFDQEINDLRNAKVVGLVSPIVKPPEAKSLRLAMDQAAAEEGGLIKLADNQPKLATTDSFKDYHMLTQIESAELKIAPFN